MPPNKIALDYIRTLGLKKHPEGGYFREIYRSGEIITKKGLPARYSGPRNFSSHIFFLITKDSPSQTHRIKSDEIWNFYDGGAVTLSLYGKKKVRKIRLGKNSKKGESFTFTIARGQWFGAEVTGSPAYALLGCTVAPGFDFADFELKK